MRLANANPQDGERDIRRGLIELARAQNALLPEQDRVLIARDERCAESFGAASNDELKRGAYIAVGAYTQSESEITIRESRRTGYLMLERYFAQTLAMWAEAQRHGDLADALRQQDGPLPPALDNEIYKAAAFVGHWLASLCPVIEGWEELKLRDAEVDALLLEGAASGTRSRLYRFRHGVFHFQRDLDDARFTDMMDELGEARAWAVRLEAAFERFFRRQSETGHADLVDWITR